MKVIVSACLAGDNCKYNGGNNLNRKMLDFLQSHEIIKVCPEVLGGLPTPRPSAENVDGYVVDDPPKIAGRYTPKPILPAKQTNPHSSVLRRKRQSPVLCKKYL